MKTLHIKTTATLCKHLFKLERRADMMKPIATLKTSGKTKQQYRKSKNLEPKLAAEILLRCGSFIGFYGHNKQIPNHKKHPKI